MRRISTILICIVFASAAVVADEVDGLFQGEWRTTIGLVKLEQKGNTVTGTYGVGDQFPLKGTVNGKVLTFEYEEGQVKGDGRFTIDDSANAFTGGFQVRNGRAGYWNGWRPDPKASADKPVTYAGLWLTDLGLMELTQDGLKVEGAMRCVVHPKSRERLPAGVLIFGSTVSGMDRDGLTLLPMVSHS